MSVDIWDGVLIVLSCIGLGMAFGKHKQPKDGEHNGWISLAAGVVTYLLYWKAGMFA